MWAQIKTGAPHRLRPQTHSSERRGSKDVVCQTNLMAHRSECQSTRCLACGMCYAQTSTSTSRLNSSNCWLSCPPLFPEHMLEVGGSASYFLNRHMQKRTNSQNLNSNQRLRQSLKISMSISQIEKPCTRMKTHVASVNRKQSVS